MDGRRNGDGYPFKYLSSVKSVPGYEIKSSMSIIEIILRESHYVCWGRGGGGVCGLGDVSIFEHHVTKALATRAWRLHGLQCWTFSGYD